MSTEVALKEEEKRQQIKARMNHIMEPMIIDMLVVKPENPCKFMREWLQARQEHLRSHQPVLSPVRARPKLLSSVTKKTSTFNN